MRYLLAAIFIVCAVVWTPTAAVADDQLAALMNGSARAPQPIGLQVVTLKAGQIEESFALGTARVSPSVPLTPRHKYRVASISKVVTAIAVMQLVEKQALQLDQDVSLYLGWKLRNPSFPDIPITLAQLLSHTSSIRDGAQYWMPPGVRFESFFKAGSPYFEDGAHFADDQAPGRFFTYSNLNFGIIAGIIEAISGERFDRYVRQHIMAPLGLDASFSACDIDPDQLATLYRGREPQVDGDDLNCHYGSQQVPRGSDPAFAELVAYWPGENPTLFSPQGGLRASAEDLAVIMQMLMAGGTWNGAQILRPRSVELMLSPYWLFGRQPNNGNTSGEGGPEGLMTGYGLSVHIAQLHQWGLSDTPKTLFGHLAEAYGLLGQFWFDPETKDGFIALIAGTTTPYTDYPNLKSPLYSIEELVLQWWLNRR